MRDDICTIPISEVFEVNDGCPLCRMKKTVEDRIIKYILGDAMMEPDVRIMTNSKGFCPEHYKKMFESSGRLQLSLMLQTHMEEICNNVFDSKSSFESKTKKAKEINESCFICDKMEWGLSRMTETIYRLYETEEDFRKLFNNQPEFCFRHYELLMSGINKKRVKKHGREMAENLSRIAGNTARALYDDISKYCSMYDYRHAGDRDFGTSIDSTKRVIDFLTAGEKEN